MSTLKPLRNLSSPSFSGRRSLMSPAAAEARSVCDKLFENLQLLIQFVDFPNLAPFALRHKLMTGEEYSRLTMLWTERHLQESIIEFLLTVRHKPDWGRKLIAALEDSITQHSDGLVHLGHVYILRELKECKAHFASGLEKVGLFIFVCILVMITLHVNYYYNNNDIMTCNKYFISS